MRKILSALFFAVAILSQTYAQKNLEWGVKAGVQLSQFRGNPLTIESSAMPVGASTEAPPTVGYAVGAYFKTTESVFLQGEVMLSVKGANIKPLAITSTSKTTKVQYTQLDIPLSIGYRHKIWEVSGGPLISVQLADDGELKKLLGTFLGKEPPFKVFVPYTFGYQLGGGVHVGKLLVGVRYLSSIMPVTSQVINYTIPNATPPERQSRFEQRSSVWQFSLALRIN
ncbi:MAG: PorT family protein [Cytophagia bacterium]|nr:MAG: PorT family protein [Runella sp.]TAG22006.1 MAG: PorT family protein [Cytophagales bacterium]TAG38945.1 MAG: PorT family protein [Cytophagia bacterium]TAG58226.1 MAG: PorT family protein [Runella slithyformis]TAG72865.1 MAG: PorT family protein [Runella slithyformis]